MPTVKELADELGVSAQTIRRYVKQELHVASEPRKALQLDATQAAIVADHFKGKTAAKVRKAADNKNDVATGNDELLQQVATLKGDVATLRETVATLKERVAGLERENTLLREQLDNSNKALEREQMQRVGFWSRLGQRLLGSGKSDDGEK